MLVDRKLESGKIVLAEYGILGLESGTLLRASGIPLTIAIPSPSSIDKDWSPVSGIQIPGLSWIPLRWVMTTWDVKKF